MISFRTENEKNCPIELLIIWSSAAEFHTSPRISLIDLYDGYIGK